MLSYCHLYLADRLEKVDGVVQVRRGCRKPSVVPGEEGCVPCIEITFIRAYSI